MDQVKFKGYAQQKGFNPIQAPYESLSQMQQQANRVLRGMESNADLIKSQRNEYEAGLRDKFSKEQNNRNQNFEFQQQVRRYRSDGKQRVAENEINNLRMQAQSPGSPELQNLKALSGLSDTIGKLVTDYAKNKKESDTLYGQNLVFQYGLTPKMLAEYETQKTKLAQGDAAANKLANQMEFRGVPTEVLEQVRGLSAWKLYGAARAFAIQGGEEYAMFRSTVGDAPVPFNGGEITLNTARTTEEWEAANAYVRTEFMRNYNGINPALLNEHLYPKMRQLETSDRVSYQEGRNKTIQENIKEQDSQDLLHAIISPGADPAAGLIGWIAQKSGGDSVSRSLYKRRAGEILAQYAQLGLIDRTQLDAIRDGSYVRADGQSRPISEDFQAQLAGAYDAAYAREKRTVDEREFKESEQKEAFKQEIYSRLAQGQSLTNEDLDYLTKQYEDIFQEEAAPWIKDLKNRTTEFFEEKAVDSYLQNLSNRGLLFTSELNRYADRFPDLVTKYKNAAASGDSMSQVPKDRIQYAKKEIDALIKEVLDKTGSDQVDSSAFVAASDMADRLLMGKLRQDLTVGNLTPEQAVDEAKQYIKNLLWDGYSGKGGPFQMKGQMVNGKFVPSLNQISPFTFQGSIPSNMQARVRAQKLREQLDRNPSYLENQVVLNPQELSGLERLAKGQGGSFPSLLSSLAYGRIDQNGNPRTLIDLANAQLRAAGKPEIGVSTADQIFKGLNPSWQIRLSRYPSTSNTYQAFSNAGDFKPVLDLIASEESAAYGHYDAMNTKGLANGTIAVGSANSKDVFGRGLSQMTVQDVMKLQRDGKVHAAGRYQIIAGTLAGLMNGGYGVTGVKPTDPFNQATQDKLGVALLKGRAGRFLTGTGSLTNAVAGMAQEWVGLQDPKARQLVTERLQELRQRYQATATMRQPETMRTNVVYKVGNIGPTSTGAHLHVGASDGGFFHRSFLDKYIRVGAKKAPVSTGVTIEGGKYGAGRSYGSHKAWDYAFDDGTPVYLANGAQVVGKRPTQHGEELTIQLPNGRQFYFLHGTAQ